MKISRIEFDPLKIYINASGVNHTIEPGTSVFADAFLIILLQEFEKEIINIIDSDFHSTEKFIIECHAIDESFEYFTQFSDAFQRAVIIFTKKEVDNIFKLFLP